mmetsp:Transcript_46343/g.75636  ORF Transcript_46343/g.75636 Transcript_46343/m.75636 type:complete len:249 (+) Transcript_46343:419-1165(+)
MVSNLVSLVLKQVFTGIVLDSLSTQTWLPSSSLVSSQVCPSFSGILTRRAVSFHCDNFGFTEVDRTERAHLSYINTREYNSAADTLSRLEVAKFVALHSNGRCYQLNPRWPTSLLLSLFGVQSAVVDAGFAKFWDSSPRLQRLIKGLVKLQDSGAAPSGRLPHTTVGSSEQLPALPGKDFFASVNSGRWKSSANLFYHRQSALRIRCDALITHIWRNFCSRHLVAAAFWSRRWFPVSCTGPALRCNRL